MIPSISRQRNMRQGSLHAQSLDSYSADPHTSTGAIADRRADLRGVPAPVAVEVPDQFRLARQLSRVNDRAWVPPQPTLEFAYRNRAVLDDQPGRGDERGVAQGLITSLGRTVSLDSRG